MAWLFGPAAWMASARSHLGDPRGAEVAWAKLAAKLLGMRVLVSGQENFDPAVQYVVAPLHEGFADAIALLQLPLRMRFVARAELLEWRVLGGVLRSGGHIVVEPESPRTAGRELLRAAVSLPADESLVVFPQGTILGVETAFSAGAFRLSSTLGWPLLPIVITGSHRVWEHPYSPTVRLGQVINIEVHPAVPPDRAVPEMRIIERRMKRCALLASPPPRRYDPDRDGWWDGYRYEIDPDHAELAQQVARHRSRVQRAAEADTL